MEISAQSLTELFTGYDLVFQRGFVRPDTFYKNICSITKSTTRQNDYPFLGRTTKFRQWLGERVIQNLEAHKYLLPNVHYEDTIGINFDDIADDIYGVYDPYVEQLGVDAATHPDLNIASLITAAINSIDTPSGPAVNGVPVPIGYDGNTFFSASHPVGLAGNTTGVSNVNSGGGGNPYWYIINGNRPIRPFIFQDRQPYRFTRMNALTDEEIFKENMMRMGVDGRNAVGVGLWQLCYASNMDLTNPANYGAARAAMRAFKTDAGQPFGALMGPASGIYLMVSGSATTNGEEAAKQILQQEFGVTTVGGAVANAPGSNIWKNTATLIVNDYL